MKIVGIGDLLIPEKYIQKGFEVLKKQGHEVKTIQWQLKDYEELQNINLMVETKGSECYEPPQEIINEIEDADVVITQFCTITKKVVDSCPNLKIIGVLRGGYENVNFKYAKEKGIEVVNTPGRNANAVADFTVGMLLSECRNIARSHKNLKEGKWVRDYTNKASVPDLCNKTIGIVGFGKVGQLVAQRMNGFDMKILIYDPYIKKVPDYVTKVSLEEIMKNADFVTIHSRLCDETYHMINEKMLTMMKPTAYIINTARSGLIDEQALYKVLKNNQICGAALDVFDEEPPTKDYPLVTLDNVTITPHLAGGTVDAFTNSPVLLAKIMMEKIN